MEDLIVRHDGTVRNSMEHIIQFRYGEDSLDACSLEVQGFDGLTNVSLFEWNDQELAEQYDRTLKFMPSTLTPERFATFLAIENKKLTEDWIFLNNFFERSNEDTFLCPINIDRLIKRIKYENTCDTEDEHNIFKFNKEFMLNPLYISGQIELMKLNIFTFTLPNGNREYRENKLFDMLLRDKLHPRRIMYHYNLDLKQFHRLLQYIQDTYMNSFVQPGEMIGTIAAQSIGEPAQQMTLNTFHSAGVSSRNVTLGVPRLTEIINCSKNPKTPSITVYLQKKYASDKEMVKQVKSMLCHTTLGDLLDPTDCRSAVANYTTETIEPYMEDFYLFQFTTEEIAQFCPWMIRLKFVPELLEIKGLSIIAIANYIEQQFGGDIKCIYSDPNASQSLIHAHVIMAGSAQMQEEEIVNFFKEIHNKLRELLICGTTGIENAFIARDQFEETEWVIETVGTNLLEILNHPMIDATKTISNHPMEVQDILGIEASHQSIIDQIRNVMEQYGINVQYRHLSVLANVMTKDGDMMSITRHGINRREDSSPLTKATFEETGDMIFEAAIGTLNDDLNSVSSRIILGLPTRLGTGFCEVAADTNADNWNDTLGVVKNEFINNNNQDDSRENDNEYENECYSNNDSNNDDNNGCDDEGFVDNYDVDSYSDGEDEEDEDINYDTLLKPTNVPPMVGQYNEGHRNNSQDTKRTKVSHVTQNADPFGFL
jgi:DNA-directed RNA polymerase II subunit RPB1